MPPALSGDKASDFALGAPSERLLSVPITLRPIGAGDEEFLYEVYTGTREQEMATLSWPESQKASFLRMQFNAQHASYQHRFPHADFCVIQCDGRLVGRLYVNRADDEILVIDLGASEPSSHWDRTNAARSHLCRGRKNGQARPRSGRVVESRHRYLSKNRLPHHGSRRQPLPDRMDAATAWVMNALSNCLTSRHCANCTRP